MPIKLADMKAMTGTSAWQEDGEGDSLMCGLKRDSAFWRATLEGCVKKLKQYVPFDTNSTLGIYLKETVEQDAGYQIISTLILIKHVNNLSCKYLK